MKTSYSQGFRQGVILTSLVSIATIGLIAYNRPKFNHPYTLIMSQVYQNDKTTCQKDINCQDLVTWDQVPTFGGDK